ncbi:MAG TPA: hypothetical protein VGI03_06495 [Verrucomicrobiae bacterium]|jgi:hypothetical protein
MKSKIVLGVILVVLLAAAAFAAFWLWRPQVVTFDDGSKLTLISVQSGTHHTPPVINGVKHARPITTTTNSLVVWLHEQYDSDEWRYFQFYAYDKANTACVGAEGVPNSNGKVNQVIGVVLDSFPRRQSQFVLRVQEQGNGGMEMADKGFTIHHAVGNYPAMAPATLPDTEEDQDLSVTLSKLATGANMPYTRDNDDPNDPMNKGIQATFQVTRNGQAVTNWQPVAVETTDATGNRVDGQIANNTWQGNDDAVIYQFGLWSDEPAWKMRFEFSQQSNFAPEELWNVPGIPIEPGKMNDFWNFFNRRSSQTNAPFAESDLNGYHLKIYAARQFTDMPPNSQPQGGLVIQVTPKLPNNMRLTIARLTDDQTNDISFWENTQNFMRGSTLDQCQLRQIDGATNLNLTIALHKSRFVEFTAKPDIAAPSDN